MKKKNPESKELILQCPMYLKALKGCPSQETTRNVLTPEEFELLMKSCTTEKYKSCSVFVAAQEKAA